MKWGIVLFIAAFVYFTIGAAPIVSQTPAAAGQTSVESSGEAVSLDLAVRGRRNKPVLDLQPGDVKVTDNGKPVPLTDLRLVNGKQKDEPLITLLFDRPGLQDTEKKSEDSLFDISVSTVQETSKRLRQEAVKLLKAFPADGFQFAVTDVWGRLQIQEGFGEDRKGVADAVTTALQPEVYGRKFAANAMEQRLAQVAKTGQYPSGAVASVRERAVARSLYTALQTSSQIAKDQHLPLSRGCLLALVEAQQSLPGRKAIIYFTSTEVGGGNPKGRSGRDSHSKDALKSIIGAANRAGVNIYVVVGDELKASQQLAVVSGSDLSTRVSEINGTVSGTTNWNQVNENRTTFARSVTMPPSESVLAVSEDMNMLAKQTGGAVLNGSENLTRPVKDLVRGLTTYYEASFVPPDGMEDGTFHTTAFKTSRKGLKLRARTGYLAIPPSAGISRPLQPYEVPLLALLKRHELPGEFDYRARVLNMEHLDEGNVGLLALEVPLTGVEVRTDIGTHLSSAHISVLVTIKDSAGTQIERFSEDLVRRWSSESSSGTAPDFLSFERSISAPPGKYVLETAILDNNSGKAAAGRQAFEIPPSQPVPELSDLMVVRGIEPADNEDSEPDLLWGNEQSVRPNLYGQLPAGAHKVSVFFLAHADPKSQEPATVNLEVLRDGTPLKGEPLSSTLKAGEEVSSILRSFTINSAANGKYEVRVTLIQGGKSTRKTDEFVLTGEAERIESAGATAAGDAPMAVDPPGLAAAEQSADRPTTEELIRILADARKNALDYADSLPNLTCQQTTQRLFAVAGIGDWKLRDAIVEDLTYVNHEETRTLLGQKTAGDLPDNRISSTGEFGGALTNIFKPESKAEFTWKETVTLRGEPAEVFDYRVAKENSAFALVAPGGGAQVGYHGRIYVDRATHGVISITNITDEVPKNFPIRKVAVRVDYDYVAINDHDYLLPVSAQLITKVSGSSLTGDLLRRNDIAFSNFHRFGSKARIVGTGTEEAPQ